MTCLCLSEAKGIIKNMINVSKENEAAILIFTENFCADIINNYSSHYVDTLLYLSEIFNMGLIDEGICNMILNNILKKALTKIEDKEVLATGMLSEFGKIVFSVNNIYTKSSNLKELSNKLNKLLIDYTYYRTIKMIPENTIMSDYDCVSGIAGVLYYILDTEYKYYTNKVSELIDYLINLTNYKIYNGFYILNYHLKRENLFREEEKEFFKDGNINFGLAHGIMGPLICLSKAYSLGFRNKNIKESIESLYDLYKQYESSYLNFYIYPTQLSFKEYIEKKVNLSNMSYNSGWCYGNISIMLGMLKVSNYMAWKKEYTLYYKKLLNLINTCTKFYNLRLPILCHGYASFITEQLTLYSLTKDPEFLKNINRNISALFENYVRVNQFYSDKIEDNVEHIEGHKNNYTFLSGNGGIFLTLLNCIKYDMSYAKILMVK